MLVNFIMQMYLPIFHISLCFVSPVAPVIDRPTTVYWRRAKGEFHFNFHAMVVVGRGVKEWGKPLEM